VAGKSYAPSSLDHAPHPLYEPVCCDRLGGGGGPRNGAPVSPAPRHSAADLEFFEQIRRSHARTAINATATGRTAYQGAHARLARRPGFGRRLGAAVIGQTDAQLLSTGHPLYRRRPADAFEGSTVGTLSEQQIADFTEGLRRGAPDPRVPAWRRRGTAYAGVGKAHGTFNSVKKPAGPPRKANAG